MTLPRSSPGHRLYPAYCFRASPTYNAWAKLTASDVQRLTAESGYEGQNIYFCLNHPIRFVRLVGVVVAIDDINLKYTVLTIDDSSGETIEVKIVRLTPDIYNPVESPSNTVVDNVNVIVRTGVFEVTVDDQNLDIGSVIKAKCTISEFRGKKQLELKRASIVRTTNEEAQAWGETAAFKDNVLSKPWHLSSNDHKRIRHEMKVERKKEQDFQKRKSAHEARKVERKKAWDEKMVEWEAKYERNRRKEEIIMNAGALI